MEIRWIFRKARWRLKCPAARLVLPRGCPPPPPPPRRHCRATLVRPDAATFSGNLYLLHAADARRVCVERRTSYELAHELWLAEAATGAPEAINYFRCRELLLPGKGVSTNATVDGRVLEAGVTALDKADREAAASPEARAIVGGAADSQVVARALWCGQARVLRYVGVRCCMGGRVSVLHPRAGGRAVPRPPVAGRAIRAVAPALGCVLPGGVFLRRGACGSRA